MQSWTGWSAAQPSRLAWEEWLELQRRRAFLTHLEAMAAAMYGRNSARKSPGVTLAVGQPGIADARIAYLEQFCGHLALEVATLRVAVQQHQQRQPELVAAGLVVGSGLRS